jgi:hypothetical protein
VALGDYRGVYNSAWIGSSLALSTVLFLSLPGFYLVKNTIERDDRTGVGQIIAATPVSKPLYTLGKAMSNLAVLSLMIGVMVLMSGVMQIVRAESGQIDGWQLLAPFLFSVLPALAVVAAMAVVFEAIAWLRGGLGNVVYFTVWLAILTTPVIATEASGSKFITAGNDLFGITPILADMTRAVKEVFPDYDGSLSVGLQFRDVGDTWQRFQWNGVAWGPALLAGRLFWLGVAVGLTLGAAFFFNRFDPSRETLARRPGRPQSEPEQAADVLPAPSPRVAPRPPAALPAVQLRFHFHEILVAELGLLLKGQRWWWYGVALILLGAGLFGGAEAVRQMILPITWIWPLLIWSSLGVREVRYRTAQLVFSAARPVTRQLPALWLAGVLVTALTGSGAGVRLGLAGDWFGVAAWLVAVAFIPSLALACGIWSGSSKLFEVLYMVLWYIGPLNHLPGLDDMGTTHAAQPLIFLAATGILLFLVVCGRQRQLQQ